MFSYIFIYIYSINVYGAPRQGITSQFKALVTLSIHQRRAFGWMEASLWWNWRIIISINNYFQAQKKWLLARCRTGVLDCLEANMFWPQDLEIPLEAGWQGCHLLCPGPGSGVPACCQPGEDPPCLCCWSASSSDFAQVINLGTFLMDPNDWASQGCS